MSNKVLEVEGISKRYSGFSIQNISFSLESGYILGLVGRNGAGKTTLMKLIQNIVRPNSGVVRIGGYDLSKDEIKARQQVGFVMEHPFFEQMTLRKNVKLFNHFYQTFDEKVFSGYLQRFELDDKTEYSQLSKGMQTKFQLAFALSHHPKLLIMDEPTGGLDPIFRREFLSVLQEVAEEHQVGIIISTHITSDLDKIADYIALIDDGELIFYKTKEELQDEYWLVKGGREVLKKVPTSNFIAIRKHQLGFEALTNQKKSCEKCFDEADGVLFERASIEDIMYYINKGRRETL